jgi:hypothetical protein
MIAWSDEARSITAAVPLMTSTTTSSRRIVEVRDGAGPASSNPRGSRVGREHGVGRGWDLGRADRTGLTFGTISSLYGLNAHIIDRTQFSLLVTVVVLSAIVPTAIAQRRYSPPAPSEHPHHLLPPHPSEILIHEPG